MSKQYKNYDVTETKNGFIVRPSTSNVGDCYYIGGNTVHVFNSPKDLADFFFQIYTTGEYSTGDTSGK